MRNLRSQRRRRGAVDAIVTVFLALASLFIVGIALLSGWIVRGRGSRRQRRRDRQSTQHHPRPEARQKVEPTKRLAPHSEALSARLYNGSSHYENSHNGSFHQAGQLQPDGVSSVSLAVRVANSAPARPKPDSTDTFAIAANGRRESNGATGTMVKQVDRNSATSSGFVSSTSTVVEPAAEPDQHEAVPIARRKVVHQIYARPTKSRWKRLLNISAAFAVVITLVVSARAASAYIGADTTFIVHINNQQPVTLDPRTSFPRSPYVFGVNVFPEEATQATDGAYGFMPYDTKTIAGLKGAGVTMLRFPGGTWGEEHTPSFVQLGAFLTLAQKTHTAPLIQVRLQGGSPSQAAAMVRYCNIASDPNRKSTPNVPFVPVRYWVIGNEPDLVGPNYTVNDYVHDFIAYATAMKAVDPSIQIYGPELSGVNGLDTLLDSTGTPWLTGFLKGIASYEQTHHTRILNGLSIHSYMFGDTTGTRSLMLSSANSWRYTLSPIRSEIQQIMGQNLPIAITEINANIHANTDPLSTALWWADNLGTLQEEHVNVVDFFAARGLSEQDMLLSSAGEPTPLYFVMQLYTHMASDVIQVGGSAGPVSVYAAASPSHDTITLMFINKSPNIAAASIEPGQTFSAWHSVRVAVPPYAIVCAVLARNGSDQSFTYGPSPTMLAHGDPGKVTVTSLP